MSSHLTAKQRLVNDLIQQLLQEAAEEDDGKAICGTLIESELQESLRFNSVDRIMLLQCDNNKFQIYITLKWKEGLHLLVTQRGAPKEWVSLDRLVQYMNKHYKSIPKITLKLRNHHESTKTESQTDQ